MSRDGNFLKEIPLDSLARLRDIFKINWPQHIIAFNLIDQMILRFKKYPSQRKLIKFYNNNGCVDEDGTFIGIIYDSRSLIISTLETSQDKLKRILNLIDFSTHRHFMCTKNLYRALLLEFLSEDKFNKILWNDETVMMHLRKEEALKMRVDVPNGFQIRSLTCNDICTVNSNWPLASAVSEKFLEHSIEFNPSIGLYDENNRLLSWCLSHDFRSLLNLFTDSNNLRKGYAELVTKAITRKLAETYNCDITASIVIENVKSLNLFKKLGFKEIDKNSWIGIGNKNEVERQIFF